MLFVLQRSGQLSLPTPAVDFYKRGGPVIQILAGSADPPAYLQGNTTDATGDETSAVRLSSAVDRIVTVDPVHPLSLQRPAWSGVTLNRPLWQNDDLKNVADAIATLISGRQSTFGSETGTGSENETGSFDVTTVFNGAADVLLAAESGMPLLLQPVRRTAEGSAGNAIASGGNPDDAVGNTLPLLIFLTPLDGISSNLPVHPVFLPFLQSVSSHMLQSGRYPRKVYTGDTLTLASNTQLLSPELQPVYELTSVGSARTHLFDTTGAYTVLEPRGSHVIQVGIDPAESDIEMLSDGNLDTWQRQYTSGSKQISANSDNTAQSADIGVETTDNDAQDETRAETQRSIQLLSLIHI